MNKTKLYWIISCLFFAVSLAGIFFIQNIYHVDLFWCFVLWAVFLVFYLLIFFILSSIIKKYSDESERSSSGDTAFVLKESNVGLLKYDESYTITSISDFFLEKKIDCVGDKVLAIFPDVEDVVNSISNRKICIFNDLKFEVIKVPNSNVLVFKDITNEYDLQKNAKDEAYVLGFANFDNYDESNASEDMIAYVNSNIKVPVIDYFKKYNVVYRTVRSNRLQLILNYKQLELLMKDRFSILSVVKNESKKGDIDLSLSMSFTYGTNDLNALDKEAVELLDLAQTRGGDQVIVRQKDKDPVYFGGSTEAKEQKSKVKVRILTNTIKQLIKSSTNILIVGHKDSDCDCVGSMMGFATFAKSYNKEVYVVLKETSLEKTAEDVIDRFSKEINNDFSLIKEDKAHELCGDNSLIVLCDHHSIDQSSCEELIKAGKKILVIDHHRRKVDLDYNAVLLYLEAGASSTCELVSEFFEFDKKIDVPEYLANMMYLGIIIDTNHFKARVNARTFDAAKHLKELGADSNLCEELSQEPFEMYKVRTEIVNNGVVYDNGIIISALEDGEYSRTLASQACNSLVETKGTKAAFVICKTNKEDVIISARSNGEINVQLILEGMNGGGHMTSAGLQRRNESVEDLKKELIENINKYFNEGKENDESNIAK